MGVKTCIVVLRVMSLEGTVVFEKQAACIGRGVFYHNNLSKLHCCETHT